MKFALITEGASEHRVIKHIIAKYFKAIEPEINQIQPKLIDDTQESTGGWNEVLKYCGRDEMDDILIENDYLIIQIDTDQSQTSPFSINHTSQSGQPKSPEQLYIDVKQKLISLIKEPIFDANAHKIFFAICIHSIECWLLPICYTDSRRTNTNNCLTTLNNALARQNKLVIPPTANNKPNGIRAYDALLKNIKRKTDVVANAQYNLGFKKFIESLDNIQFIET
jgi:hypothetical protein